MFKTKTKLRKKRYIESLYNGVQITREVFVVQWTGKVVR
jgi:hypothetical protein